MFVTSGAPLFGAAVFGVQLPGTFQLPLPVFHALFTTWACVAGAIANANATTRAMTKRYHPRRKRLMRMSPNPSNRNADWKSLSLMFHVAKCLASPTLSCGGSLTQCADSSKIREKLKESSARG